MGAARRRGTFEERRAAAIERAGIEREERKRLEAERLAKMTEEERHQQRDKRLVAAQIMAFAMAQGFYPYRTTR